MTAEDHWFLRAINDTQAAKQKCSIDRQYKFLRVYMTFPYPKPRPDLPIKRLSRATAWCNPMAMLIMQPEKYAKGVPSCRQSLQTYRSFASFPTQIQIRVLVSASCQHVSRAKFIIGEFATPKHGCTVREALSFPGYRGGVP